MNENKFVIITSNDDLPTRFYEDTHQLYLCVLSTGKTVVCKYYKQLYYGWINANNSRDLIRNVVAYMPITVPENVINACKGNPNSGKYVEYFDGLNSKI